MTYFSARRAPYLLALGVAACGSISSTPGGGGASGAAGTGAGSGGVGVGGSMGGNPDAGTLDAPAVTTAEACQQQAVAVCDAIDECAAVAIKYFYVDKPTCVSRQTLGCMSDQMVPDTTRTAEDILACKHDVIAASCANLLASKLPTSCLVKPGTQLTGGVCGSDWQCASTYCSKSAAACGTCAERAAANGACTVDAGCQTGLVCANNVCVPPGTLVGSACDGNHPCASDMYCTKVIFGSCALKVGLGASCADSDKACDILKSVGCNLTTHVCEMFNVASGGNACGIVDNALTLCANLGPCPGFSILQAQGVCANPAADGAPCGDAANGVVCLPPATCTGGVCQLPSVSTCQ